MKKIAAIVVSALFVSVFAAGGYEYIDGVYVGFKKSGYSTPYVWNSVELSAGIDRFEVLEIGGLADIKENIGILDSFKRDNGEKLLAYEWLAGFYESQVPGNPFLEDVMKNRRSYLIDAGEHPMAGDDHYYDICNDDLVEKRVSYLVGEVKNLGIDGLFFDWGNAQFLEESSFIKTKERFESLHPGMRYEDCVGRFWSKLKEKGIFIVSNQAYRDPSLLDYVDYDMIESYLTTDEEIYLDEGVVLDGKKVGSVHLTQYYPIDTENGSIEDTRYYVDYLRDLKADHESLKNFVFMNYAAPRYLKVGRNEYVSTKPIEAIYYSYAFAKLIGAESYTEVLGRRDLEWDMVYSVDLGNPKGENYAVVDGGYVRYYEHGLVAVFPASLRWRKISFDVPEGVERVLDLKNRHGIDAVNGEVSVKVRSHKDPLTGTVNPIGVVLLW